VLRRLPSLSALRTNIEAQLGLCADFVLGALHFECDHSLSVAWVPASDVMSARRLFDESQAMLVGDVAEHQDLTSEVKGDALTAPLKRLQHVHVVGRRAQDVTRPLRYRGSIGP
jgi:hypothetical protein